MTKWTDGKPKYKIVDSKGNIVETFRTKQTAIDEKPKFEKMLLEKLDIQKIGG